MAQTLFAATVHGPPTPFCFFMTAFQQLQALFSAEDRPLTAPLPLQQHADGRAMGHFSGLDLHSHFQPLFNTQQQAIAYEALLRPCVPGGSNYLAPNQAFALASTAQTAIYLDRLCRVVHALNFVRQQPGTAQLFLNVSPQHLQAVTHNYGATFEAMLALCGLRPQQVVLEILEAGHGDVTQLQLAVQGWRNRGFQIALDDFGCQNSNFDRLWQLTPDIVKLDKQLVHQAQSNQRAAIILPKLIEMIHDLGALVVCEGIETLAQHQRCTNAGADLLQGYFYARPAAHLHTVCSATCAEAPAATPLASTPAYSS